MALHDQLFVAVSRSDFDTSKARLYSFSPDITQWVELSMPTTNCGLTTYRSNLALVGGLNISSRKFTNIVWMSNDGKSWKSPLPPLSTFRTSPLVVNTGNPEYLVVVGGIIFNEAVLDTVEVLIDEQWSAVESLPRPHHSLGLTFHNGNLLLMGWEHVLYCRLESLLAACASSNDGEQREDLWKKFKVPMNGLSPVSFMQKLLAIGGDHKRCFFYATNIHAFSPLSQEWVLVGDLPLPFYHSRCVVLSTGELVVVGQTSDLIEIYKASLKSEQY